MQDRRWEKAKRKHVDRHAEEFTAEHPELPPGALDEHIEVRHQDAPEKSHEKLRYDLDKL